MKSGVVLTPLFLWFQVYHGTDTNQRLIHLDDFDDDSPQLADSQIQSEETRDLYM